MKIGVSSYSFSRLVKSGAMQQIEVIRKAKEIGFDVIEFSTIAVPEGKTLPGNLKVGDRVTVDYTPQRVAVAAAGGTRQCLQFLVVSSVKPAAK